MVVILAEKKAFDSAARSSPGIEPCGQHPCVIQYEHVARRKQRRQIREPAVIEHSSAAIEDQQTGLITDGARGLGDAIGGQIVIEFVGVHAGLAAKPSAAIAVGRMRRSRVGQVEHSDTCRSVRRINGRQVSCLNLPYGLAAPLAMAPNAKICARCRTSHHHAHP